MSDIPNVCSIELAKDHSSFLRDINCGSFSDFKKTVSKATKVSIINSEEIQRS